MRKLKYVKLFENFQVNESDVVIPTMEEFEEQHPVGSKFKVKYVNGPKWGDIEEGEILKYSKGGFSEKEKRNILIKINGKENYIGHNQLFGIDYVNNKENAERQISSSTWILIKWL
jgi:hypothetical protein